MKLKDSSENETELMRSFRLFKDVSEGTEIIESVQKRFQNDWSGSSLQTIL